MASGYICYAVVFWSFVFICLFSLLKPDVWNEANGSCRPLDETVLNRIKLHWTTLTEIITLEGGLVAKLYAKNCISNIQRKSIESVDDGVKKNKRLLEIMSRKSAADFNRFIICLQETQQGHIAGLLLQEDLGRYYPAMR